MSEHYSAERIAQTVDSLRSIGDTVAYQLGDDNTESRAARIIEQLQSKLDEAETRAADHAEEIVRLAAKCDSSAKEATDFRTASERDWQAQFDRLIAEREALRHENADLHEQVAALQSREVCTVAHDDVEVCGYCQRDALQLYRREVTSLLEDWLTAWTWALDERNVVQRTQEFLHGPIDDAAVCNRDCERTDLDVCRARSADGFCCTRRIGHEGDHMACGTEGEHSMATWSEPGPISNSSTGEDSNG